MPKDHLSTLISALQSIQQAPAIPHIRDTEFPIHAFPEPVATWLTTSAAHARVRVSLVALPFLALTGATIGQRLALEIVPGWIERPNLWTALVSLTGLGKTPALAAAREPFLQLHHDAWNDHNEAATSRKRRSRTSPAPFDPILITTATSHALNRTLAHSTGCCILRDELYGVIRAVDRRRGEDRQYLLSLWSAEPILPTTPEPAPIITAPVVSLAGGIQPAILARLQRRQQDGLLERFLFAAPDPVIDRWDHETVAANPLPDPEPVLTILRAIRTFPVERGPTIGTHLHLAPSAHARWVEWHSQYTDLHVASTPVIAGFYRKFPSHLTRIALILHTLWHSENLASDIAERTFQHAIDLLEYYRVHTHRVAQHFGELDKPMNPNQAIARRIINLLKVTTINGGWIPRTNLIDAIGRPRAASFEHVIIVLIERGIIETRTTKPDGPGRPATEYRLHDNHRPRPSTF